MSDLRRRARSGRDKGMTLPELLISITVIGLIVTVLAGAVVVTLRQEPSTSGRLNVARDEQNLGLWLPGDLASAAAISTDPAASPCGRRHDAQNLVADPPGEPEPNWQILPGVTCPDLGLNPGSNALLVGWSTRGANGVYTYTNVSYFYSQADNGTFLLSRITCIDTGGGWSCTAQTLLRDLPGPPAGDPWEPGVTEPTWIIQVSMPLATDVIDDDSIGSDDFVADEEAKDGRRVVVTVNGGGGSGGAGGGTNNITVSAGGTNRDTIGAQSVQGAPSFIEARSKCGGPLTLVVDESVSITDDYIDDVRAGVKAFVQTLIGTPVRIQVVAFNDRARALGGQWHRYFDMTNQTDVNTLLSAIDNPTSGIKIAGGGGSPTPVGYTNWEDALFHAFRNENGSTADVVPEKLVFFTDGVPTRDRQSATYRNGVLPAQPEPSGPGWGPTNTGSAYSQVAFDRAEFYATWARSSVTMIGVAVGPDVDGMNTFVDDPGAGYHLGWERQSAWAFEERANWDWETAAYQSRSTWTYEGGYWTNRDPQGNYWARTYFDPQGNYWKRTNFDPQGNYWKRTNFDPQGNYWARTNFDPQGNYWAQANFTYQHQYLYEARYQVRNSSTGPWYFVNQTTYAAKTPTTDRRDLGTNGWTAVDRSVYDQYNVGNHTTTTDGLRRTAVWTGITAAEYAARNTSSGDADGYRATNPSGAWVNVTKAYYDASNLTATATDGFTTGWTVGTITQTQYNTNNTVIADTDGYRMAPRTGTNPWVNVTKAVYDAANYLADDTDGYTTGWTVGTITQNQYNTNNTVIADTDGYRMAPSAGTNPWVNVTKAVYDAANYLADDTDGYTTGWTVGTITQTQYNTNNTVIADTDGYRMAPSAGTNPWVNVTKAVYDAANYLADDTDGYTTGWTVGTITQAQYNANNTNPTESDGYRIGPRAGTNPWVNVTKAVYDANNTLADDTDGYTTGWTTGTISFADYAANNTNTTETDGYRLFTRTGSGAWINITKAVYDTNNTTGNNSDGFDDYWDTITSTQYNANNTTNDATDGYRRATPGGAWVNITKAEYDANNTNTDESDGYRIVWSNTTKALYHASNTVPGESDGWRRDDFSGGWVAMTEAQYNANNTSADDSDGVRRANPSGAWVAITEQEYDASNSNNNESDGYREVKVYSPPFQMYDPLVGSSIRNDRILGRLIAGGDNYVTAIRSGSTYTNTDVANLYSEPNWAQLTPALKAAALGDCGGTLTLQTRKSGTPVADPFTYVNTSQKNASGQPLQINPTTVFTSHVQPTGTFDFNITDGLYRDVVIQPSNLVDLDDYSYSDWVCRAGAATRTFTPVNIANSTWKGISVRVGANEAVSCTLNVT